ncbi:MAG TPA: diaminopimelate epimerase [Candidatus Limnocylindrales bacterium]
MRFTKGHGTGNDFILLDESVELNRDFVVAVCDRRFGIGADGVLRVAREGELFFMDFWNSDGSIGEMCGNGLRVFVRYLFANGLAEGDSVRVLTRAGIRTAYLDGDDIRVDMDPPRILGRSWASVSGVRYEGLAVSMGNPHLVCDVEGVAPLDLSVQPEFDKEFFPDGVNVEFSQRLGDRHVRMRVYERGARETMSCGTGAVACGVALLDGRPGEVTVDVPGGRLKVSVDEQTSWLTGPAVLTFTGELGAGFH